MKMIITKVLRIHYIKKIPMKKQMIIDAYCKIRTIDNTIPDDVLDFMKEAALEKLKAIELEVASIKEKQTEAWLERGSRFTDS